MKKNVMQEAFLRCVCAGLAVSVLLAPGCGKSHTSTRNSYAVNKTSSGQTPKRGVNPYAIDGKTYYPITDARGYKENGVASWYGPDFHGKTTANGETYDMYDMTAAHKILPFGTKLMVTNVENGRSILVRVNDRGPFVGSRIIDLSKMGADKLGMLASGTAKVRIEVVEGGASPTPNVPSGSAPPPGPGRIDRDIPMALPAGTMTAGSSGGKNGNGNSGSGGNYYVQVGAFGSKANAELAAQTLNSQGHKSRISYADNTRVWRVQAGPYNSQASAEQARRNILNYYDKALVLAD